MENHAEYRKELRKYATGLGWALLLTAIPFAVVAWHLLSPVWALTLIFILGLTQVVAHFKYFLHIGRSSHRDDLNLLLFSTLIVLLMVGGTLVVLFNLHSRMV
ncbi:cytochrome C oxidase subunit IV family protein [Oleiagrimonas sp. C23AA]|uniref:cytochrome o ubiquinol oxidase subunit IV n=1 Tax=Oleiagrimonas sp. C23AA TaxID=2719047 RepID=UPI001421342F|nr:cytochrome C oxidase subunit IV family protein [Oleiagrimonas sp. C23AA]NII10849.1 cytochrome-c oxidase [Oleiagrimonas sp. C23AA]